jgi:hypothetical protein
MYSQYNPCTGLEHSDAYPRHRTAGQQRLCKKEKNLINKPCFIYLYDGLQTVSVTPTFAFSGYDLHLFHFTSLVP